MQQLYTQLADLAAHYGARRLVLFGSRARGDNSAGSDIDLAVYGMPAANQARFRLDAEELPTLLKLDVVQVIPDLNQAFLNNITRDGVDLMNKFREKYEKLCVAYTRLQEAVADYQREGLDSIRDGVIQRFEFCTELAWKTMREYLLDQGYTELNSPKDTLRQAFTFGMVQDEKWLTLLDDRNLTSHVYDEATAKAIFERIQSDYVPLFAEVIAYMK